MRFSKIAVLILTLPPVAGAAMAFPRDWQVRMPEAASPVMEQIAVFYDQIMVPVTASAIFVAGLLIAVLWRFRRRVHPSAAQVRHNTALQIAWTVIPALVLVAIAWPSLQLMSFETTIPKPGVTVQVTGHQWYWTYAYPKEGGLKYDSTMLPEVIAKQSGEPRLLGADYPLTVPVNTVVEVEVTGADVIHTWAVPSLGVKIDAVPGHINHGWFKATKTGTYYGQCTGSCGAGGTFMPVAVKVVTLRQYREWLAITKYRFTGE